MEWDLVSISWRKYLSQICKERRETEWQRRERAAQSEQNGLGDSRNTEAGWLGVKGGLRHCVADPLLVQKEPDGKTPTQFPQ